MNHEEFMKEAIRIAERGIKEGQTPFGAVIVKNNRIIAKAHNTVFKDNDPTAHAEINAIRKASKKLKTIDLKGCVIYSTCEPCPMCFSAIHWANIDAIYYGASIRDAEKLGFRELRISNKRMKSLSKKTVKLKIVGGVMKEECRKMMKKWKGKTY